HRLAHAAGTGDPVSAEAGRDIEAADTRLTEDEFVVRREGFRPVDQFDDVAALQRWHPLDRVLRERLEARPIFRQQPVVEVRGDSVKAPGCGITFVTSHDETTRI